MDWDLVIILGGATVIAGGVGLGLAILSVKLKNYSISKRAIKFLEGKSENPFMMDGERINVNKFKWKDREGVMQTANLNPREREDKVVQLPVSLPVHVPVPDAPVKEPERKFKQLSDYK